MWHAWRRGSYWVLVGKTEGERPIVRARHRLEDNIRIDLLDWFMEWI